MSQHTATLPPLPEGWVWTTLGEVAHILDSRRVPINSSERNKRIEGKNKKDLYAYYGATGQVGWIDDFLFDEEIVLLGEDGAPFLDTNKPKAYLIKGKSWVNNHAHVLSGIEKVINNLFLQHYLNIFDYHGYVTGTTRLKLTQTAMRQIPIPIPPLAEQTRIVEALETLFTQLDAGVQALKRSQANLQRYRAAVLKAACEGTLVAQDPNDEPASQLLTRILAERYERWEEGERAKGKMPMPSNYKAPQAPDTSNLPDLPEGWVWATVEQVLEYLQYGTSVKADAEAVNGVPVLRMGNIKEGSIAYNNLKYLDPEKEDIEKYTLHKQDILINRTNSPELVGKSALFQGSQIYTFASYLIRIRCIYGLVNPSYLVFCFNSEIGRAYIAKVRHQVAGQANINSQDIRQFNFPLPPLAEQARIVAEVERRLSVVQALEATLEANLARAERLRQSILKQAFSGQLVPQDPSDEPASLLLEQIQAERAPAPKSAKQRTQTRMDLE